MTFPMPHLADVVRLVHTSDGAGGDTVADLITHPQIRCFMQPMTMKGIATFASDDVDVSANCYTNTIGVDEDSIIKYENRTFKVVGVRRMCEMAGMYHLTLLETSSV